MTSVERMPPPSRAQQPLAESPTGFTPPYTGPVTSSQLVALQQLNGIADGQRRLRTVTRKPRQENDIPGMQRRIPMFFSDLLLGNRKKQFRSLDAGFSPSIGERQTHSPQASSTETRQPDPHRQVFESYGQTADRRRISSQDRHAQSPRVADFQHAATRAQAVYYADEHKVTAHSQYASAPSDAEKYWYLQGQQKRWFMLLQYVAFLGVIISFIGFTLSSYETLIFGVPMVLFIAEQALSLYTSTRPRRLDLAGHRSFIENWAPRRYASIDTFLPTAGEDLDLLDNTMRNLNQLVWPGELRVFILDDSDRFAVRQLAQRYGFHYVARPGSEFKKAGNLRYAAQRTSGEIIVIFDADFVPRFDFLTELVPYLDDPTVGIVQSPQFFDTTKQMNWIQRTAGSTQELFYRFIQPSRDALDSAVCVGTSALYRRAALDSIGGFPLMGQSEDIYTGLFMRDAGYIIRYVPVIVSKGMAPDNLDNFIAQQYRWCEGSITMLTTRRFHTTPHLPLSARLCFWSGFLYYITTALNSLIIPLPIIIMTWFYPEWVREWNTVWLAGVLVAWFVGYPLVMRSRWRIEVLRLQTVYGFSHLFNILHLMGNQVAEWHPTGSKAPAPVAIQIKRFYTIYLGLALSIGTCGLVLRIAQDGASSFLGMTLFFLLNLYIVGPLVLSGIGDMLRDLRKS